jgi:hypothetical protein
MVYFHVISVQWLNIWFNYVGKVTIKKNNFSTIVVNLLIFSKTSLYGTTWNMYVKSFKKCGSVSISHYGVMESQECIDNNSNNLQESQILCLGCRNKYCMGLTRKVFFWNSKDCRQFSHSWKKVLLYALVAHWFR